MHGVHTGPGQLLESGEGGPDEEEAAGSRPPGALRRVRRAAWPAGVAAAAVDPLDEQAAEIFADQLAADRVPSVRAIRAQLHVGQPRAQRLRDHLAAGAARRAESPAA